MYDLCAEFNWIPVSMKNDWKTIYAEGVKYVGKQAAEPAAETVEAAEETVDPAAETVETAPEQTEENADTVEEPAAEETEEPVEEEVLDNAA